mmetsp:Transcript_15085/g.42873  ORF Transcript_15085/g.42873 Transcript_15085/m.42873 type:complete len:228 (-) Transcript_15085:57-740(-)
MSVCSTCKLLLKLLAPPHTPRHLFLKRCPILPPLLCRIYVCRTLIVRRREHANNRKNDGLDRVHRTPLLRHQLVRVHRIKLCRVENADAHTAIRKHVRVPDLAHKPTLWRRVGIVLRELERRLKKSALVQRLGRPQNRDAPFEEVVVRQPGRESVHRVLCQLLQLLAQQERCLIRRHSRGSVLSHATPPPGKPRENENWITPALKSHSCSDGDATREAPVLYFLREV